MYAFRADRPREFDVVVDDERNSGQRVPKRERTLVTDVAVALRVAVLHAGDAAFDGGADVVEPVSGVARRIVRHEVDAVVNHDSISRERQ